MLGFLKRHARVLAAVALLVAVLGLATGPLTLAVPRSCDVCHAEGGERAEWAASAHAGIGCGKCHADRSFALGLGNSAKLAYEARLTLTGQRPGERAWVPDSACLECHSSIEDAPPVVSGGLRMAHVGISEGGLRCTDCHADAAHEVDDGRIPQPTMSTCATCHNGIAVSGECDLCHTGDRDEGEAREIDAEWAATHGANWEEMHGMGDLSTCVLCHEHSKCAGCHGVDLPHNQAFASSHGDLAKKARDACTSCHTQAYCESCHGIEMPHPEGFLAEHPSIATGLTDPACERCHTTTNCNECHVRHTHPGRVEPMRPPGGSE